MKKVSSMQAKLKMVAIFVAGLAVATFGWWQSNRLNLAYGSGAGINEVRSGWNIAPVKNCSPADRPMVNRKYDGCNITETTTKCNPNRRYVTYAKTRTGGSTWISSTPVKGAMEEVSYESSVEEKKLEIKSEMSRVKEEIDGMKKAKSAQELAKDSDYMVKYTYMKELDNASRKCLPRPTSTNPVNGQKVPQAR